MDTIFFVIGLFGWCTCVDVGGMLNLTFPTKLSPLPVAIWRMLVTPSLCHRQLLSGRLSTTFHSSPHDPADKNRRRLSAARFTSSKCGGACRIGGAWAGKETLSGASANLTVAGIGAATGCVRFHHLSTL